MDDVKESYKVCDHCGIRSINTKPSMGGIICNECEKRLQDEHVQNDVIENGYVEVAQ